MTILTSTMFGQGTGLKPPTSIPTTGALGTTIPGTPASCISSGSIASSLTEYLNISGSSGVLQVCGIRNGSGGSANARLQITIDGVVVYNRVLTSMGSATSHTPVGTPESAATSQLVVNDIIQFNTGCKIEALSDVANVFVFYRYYLT